ncbi:hypothetical protein M404DRAFT_994302 [Pisolithus tinctorius Marx 270]|uniref:Uncharacterized protein n=1 Tax=Pisolithus tinctorius Marx 270 TaxID=870435 RepID=A0A0C3JQU6_PISTI|nr:hypothetical protein M404DRAFT_994302 [Pisolithus tinctorius Marx 270]
MLPSRNYLKVWEPGFPLFTISQKLHYADLDDNVRFNASRRVLFPSPTLMLTRPLEEAYTRHTISLSFSGSCQHFAQLSAFAMLPEPLTLRGFR